MQYHGNTSEEDLLNAGSVKLHITGSPDPWHDCRVVKRDGKLFAQTSQGSTLVSEYRIPDTAAINQSSDGLLIVMFPSEDAST